MKPSLLFLLLLLLSTPLFHPELAHAGATCMAKSEDGKILTLDIECQGSSGSFVKATVTIVDEAGKTILEHVYHENSQYAATMRDGKALVIVYLVGEHADVQLNFIGKDQDDYELLPILQDPNRKKDPGNSLTVNAYSDGDPVEYTFDDIVCVLSKDA